MLDKCYKYKLEFKDYIVFIKSGIFYECIGKDALIINKLFNYKIKRVNSTFKCGFPVRNISSVTGKLADNNINYIVEDNNLIIDKYETDSNAYSNYNIDIDSLLYRFILIEKIIKYLENNITNDEIGEKIYGINQLLGI